MKTFSYHFNRFVALFAILLGVSLNAAGATTNSVTISETWTEGYPNGVHTNNDAGTFTATLIVPGLSTLSTSSWSNLEVSIGSAPISPVFTNTYLYIQPADVPMSAAPSTGGTVTATNAVFYFQAPDINNVTVNVAKTTYSRSGNTFTITEQTLNPPSLSATTVYNYSMLAWNYLDNGSNFPPVGSTFPITDYVDLEITLQASGGSGPVYADLFTALFVVGTNTISHDGADNEINQITISGVADFTPPTLTAVSPTSSQVTTNSLQTITVKAADNKSVANVEYFLNGLDYGSGFQLASNYWSMYFALTPGTNVIQEYAADLSGNLSSNKVVLTYQNRQTNANLITYSEHWQDMAQTDYFGGPFNISQDVGTLNAALSVPGLQGLSPATWSNLVVVLSFGDIVYTNNLSAARLLTASRAVFDLNSTLDSNSNVVVETTFSLSRSGNTLVLAYETGNATYDFDYPIFADFYLGVGSSFSDVQPFSLTLQDGSNSTVYANIAQNIFISGIDSTNFDAQTNELDLVQVSGQADFAAPTNQIVAPVNGLLWSNASFTITGKAADNVGVSNVFYSLNGSPWTGADSTNGYTNWSAVVTLTPGTNTIQAYAIDYSGHVSLTNSARIIHILSAVLTVNVGPGGTVVTNYNGRLLQIGKVYSMTAKTNTGFGFAGWTGSIVTNTPKLTFVMDSNLVFNANFTDIQPPTNQITAPVSGLRWSNSVITITGKSHDDLSVSNVFVSVNNTGWTNAASENGFTNWQVAVMLTPGTNTIAAYAVDTTGNVSKTNTVSFVYVLSAVLTVNVGPGGTIVTNYNGHLLQIGAVYSMTAKTNVGFAFARWTGSITTNSAKLTFVMASNLVFNASFTDIQPPTNQITAPTSGLHWSNSVFTVTGKSHDNIGVSNVFVSLNNTGWTNAASEDGFTNWQVAVMLTPGTNTVAVYSMDVAGNVSKTNSVSFVYVLSDVLTVNVGPGGTVVTNYNGHLLQLGAVYSMTAKTNVGFAFAGWTGIIMTNNPKLTFVMESNLVFNASFVDTLPPTNLITAPTPGQQWSNSVFIATGKATDNLLVTNVFFSLNHGGWSEVDPGNNFTNWTAELNLSPGTNTFATYAVDSSGNISKTNTVNFVYVVSGALVVSTNGIGIITPVDNGALLQIGKNYTLTAAPVPGSGFAFSNWQGGTNLPLSLLTNKPVLQFTMQEGLMLEANFVYTNQPTLTITNPLTTIRTSNVVYTVSGHATDKAGVTGVFYSLNGADYVAATQEHGWTNWSATVNLALGTNTVQVYAVNASNNLSAVKEAVIIRGPAVSLFPVAVGENIRHPQARQAFDGTNYFVVFQVYPPGQTNNSSAAGQFISTTGETVGSELALNPGGQDDPPWVAFDGTNYVVAWADYSDAQSGVPVKGVFVSPGGTVGSVGRISQSANVDDFNTIVFGGGVYFMMWSDDRTSPDSVYGALMDTSGNVVASDFLISTNASLGETSQASAAFDGTNFLAVWAAGSGHMAVYGQFIDTAGNLLGDPITIYTNTSPASRALASVTFDGTKYLVLFTIGLNTNIGTAFHVLGRFVTTEGAVMDNQITLTTDAGPQIAPAADFDGENYLITWNQGFNPFSHLATSGSINGRFFNAAGQPVTAEFPVFTPPLGHTATWAPVLFDGVQYMTVTGIGQIVAPAPGLEFTNGIISGAFIQP